MIQSRRAREVRKRAATFMDYLYSRRGSLGYQEYRPMRSFETPYLSLPDQATDCSESSALILRAAGAPTPFATKTASGWAGYTGTFLSTLKRIPKIRTRRGDAVVICTTTFPAGAHMVLLKQGGLWHRDPLVWSHGRPGVDVMPLSEMLLGFPTRTDVVLLRTVPLRY